MSITKQDIQQIINNVRENLKKLDGCIGPHEFKLHDNRYTCLKCKGTVDKQAHYWYQHGINHGRQDKYSKYY